MFSGFGFVRFLDKEDARKANILNPHNSRMANVSNCIRWPIRFSTPPNSRVGYF